MNTFRRRGMVGSLLALLLVVQFGVFLPTREADAQLPVPVYDVATHTELRILNLRDTVRIGLVGAAVTGVINAINFMAQKFAYDAAEQVSEGNIGKTTFINGQSWGDYLSDLADGAIGELIGTISESGLAGFNLCDPNNAKFIIAFTLGLIDDVNPPKPKCSWRQIKANYATFGQRVKTGQALQQFGVAFQPGQSGLGVAVESSSKIAVAEGKAVNAGLQKRLQEGGFKSLRDSITFQTKTPSELVREQAIQDTIKNPKDAQGLSYQGMLDVAVNAPGAIGLSAMNTFITHLTAKLLKKVFKGNLFFSLADLNSCVLGLTGCNTITDPNAIDVGGGGNLAQQINGDLITPPLQQDSTYDPITDFSVCPDTGRGVNNCVMDSQFAALFSQYQQNGNYLTVRDAIAQGFIHGDWPLVGPTGSTQARNADPYCFSSAYCYSNIVKMRKHRILPIGWELAAAKSTENLTQLSEVIAHFNDCPTAQDPDPSKHPWCHLIDPDWVIKLPVTQCRMKVNGETMLDPESPTRAQVCVDTPSCIAEDEHGNCVSGYGYCAREQNTWRFGAKSCDAPYASCAQFTNNSGDNLTLLQNTLEYNVCSADNTGCRGFATTQNSTDWQYTQNDQRITVNAQATACDGKSAGCTTVIKKVGLSRNVVNNPSFESQVDTKKTFDPTFWRRLSSSGNSISDSSDARSGTHAMRMLSGTDQLIQTVNGDLDQTYTLSFYARQIDSASNATIKVFMVTADAEGDAITFVPKQVDCILTGGNVYLSTTMTPTGTSYERGFCSFTIPPGSVGYTAPAEVTMAFSVSGTGGVLLDDVQMEEGTLPTDYHEAPYVGGTRETLKVAPEYLHCEGKPSDASACAQYAGVCTQDEVGCNAYTPTAGGTAVTAVTSTQSGCPRECVGYQTFRKEVSQFDVGADPLYLIPTSAQSCSASAIGCSEFTNIDAQATGGEALAYFSSMRVCEKPGTVVPTYYTWEGSDTSGYQLKEWHLKEGAPLAGTSETGAPPAVTVGYDPAVCTKAFVDARSNPDCREFFDVQGNISYRLYSKTILITDQCTTYRLTQLPTINIPPSSISRETTCESAANQGHWVAAPNASDPTNDGTCSICEALGGTWDGATTACRFLGYAPESQRCNATDNKCRLFTGNAGKNVQNLLNQNFEGDVFYGWPTIGQWTTSTEATVVGGHSLRSASSRIDVDLQKTGITLENNDIYFLTFWAKGPATDLNVVLNGGATSVSFTGKTQPVLQGNWQQYQLGPVTIPTTMTISSSLLTFNLPKMASLTAGTYWYVDNVNLQKVGSGVSLIDNTWRTPNSCDQTDAGVYLPQAQLGCAAYTTPEKVTVALKSFDHLCRAAAVGCQAFINTRNTDFQGYEYWNAMIASSVPAIGPQTVTSQDVAANEDGGAITQLGCTIGSRAQSCRFHAQSGVGPAAPSRPYIALGNPLGTKAPVMQGTGVTCSRLGPGPCLIDGTFICTATGGTHATNTCVGRVPDLVTVAPDQTVYLIDNAQAKCESSGIGCTVVGQPKQALCTQSTTCTNIGGCGCTEKISVCNTDATGPFCQYENRFACTIAKGEKSCTYPLPAEEGSGEQKYTYTQKYLTLNPAKYDKQVCTSAAIGCDTWRSTNLNAPSVTYFKNPDGRLCDYRENVQINGLSYSGYFQQGTTVPCDESYQVNGNYYNIRKNTDSAYNGFVGMCPQNQAACTEFVDPTDIEQTPAGPAPKSYYIIKDKSVDLTSCNGQVSPKDGCVLVQDTSNLSRLYSAVGSYNDSEAAGNAKVPAQAGACMYSVMGCVDDGTKTATGKAAYLKISVDANGVYTSSAIEDLHLQGDLGPGWVVPYYANLNDKASSVFWPYWKGLTTHYQHFDQTALDAFCKQWFPVINITHPQTPENIPIAYVGKGCSSDGQCVAGGIDAPNAQCITNSTSAGNLTAIGDLLSLLGGQTYVHDFIAPANAVVKVGRDRICSQWYTCQSSTPQWDPRVGRFRDVCDQVGLCDASSAVGPSSAGVDVTQCKHFVSSGRFCAYAPSLSCENDASCIGGTGPCVDSTNILSEQLYQSRDVTWTGSEYSGYSIPHLYPLQTLRTAKVANVCAVPASDKNAKNLCGKKTCSNNVTQECTTNANCTNNGICGQYIHCDSCTSDAECPTVGANPTEPGPHYRCEQYLSLGHDAGACSPNTKDGASCHPYGDTTAPEGRCYQGRCFYAPYGNTDPSLPDATQPLVYQSNATNNTLTSSCRAYPEADSPVPNSVVKSWNKKNTLDEQGPLPLSVIQGFQGSRICEDGQECECSYQKTTYGSGAPRYFSAQADPAASVSGVCAGGPYDGESCDPGLHGDDKLKERSAAGNPPILSCNSVDERSANSGSGQAEGICTRIKRQDFVQGLSGYCLERDPATVVYGRGEGGSVYDQENVSRACITWLPVDRLIGETDVFNSFTSATYSNEDTYQCLVPQTYAALHTSGYHELHHYAVNGKAWPVTIGCVPVTDDGSPDPSDTSANNSRFNTCPPNVGWMIVSEDETEAAHNLDELDIFTGDHVCYGEDGETHQFYQLCVPWGSVHTDSASPLYGKECTPLDLGGTKHSFPHGACAPGSGWNQTGCNDTFAVPRFTASSWPATNSPRDWGTRHGRPEYDLQDGDSTPVFTQENAMLDTGLRSMYDCYKFDAPMSSEPTAAYGNANLRMVDDGANGQFGITNHLSDFLGDRSIPTSYYFGCSVLAQVSQGPSKVDMNKAYTDRTGTTLLPPPDSSFTVVPTGNANSSLGIGPNQQWHTPSTPFANGMLINPNNLNDIFGPYMAAPSADLAAPSNPGITDPAYAHAYVFLGIHHNLSICDVNGGDVAIFGTCFTYNGQGGDGLFANAAAHLHELFAKTYQYKVYDWTSGKGGYVNLNEAAANVVLGSNFSTNGVTGDVSAAIAGMAQSALLNSLTTDLSISDWDSVPTQPAPHAPQIFAVQSCDTNNRCTEGAAGGFTINGKNSGDVVGTGGQLRTIFRFFADAGFNMTPLRDVMMIYDVKDRALMSSGHHVGIYKNHRGFVPNGSNMMSRCDASQPGATFGQTADACDDSGPFTFVYTYTCSNKQGQHCQDGTDLCWDPSRKVCVYEPAVYAINNHGICTGVCKGGPSGDLCGNNGGSSASVENNSKGTIGDPGNRDPNNADECNVDNYNLTPYVKYKDTVLVYPPQ